MNQTIKCKSESAPETTISWEELKPHATFFPRNAVLEMVVELSFLIPGNIVEFGVAEGTSTRILRQAASECEKRYPASARKKVFACDSFRGLPERFENADVGTFATEPPVIAGVKIVEGYFQDSLTDELAREVESVAFASLDADLYSSTLCALTWLTPLLRSGSLLLFDEFLGENESERRAFDKWSADTGIRTLMIAEFRRVPSGWGNKIDCRTLFQVIGDDQPTRQRPLPWRENPIGRGLRRYPTLYNVARRIYRLVK